MIVANPPTDTRLRAGIVRQLEWDPAVDDTVIHVEANAGIVTLTGRVSTYPEKLAAEKAAKRVHGVRAVRNQLDVVLKVDRTDEDIADDAAEALRLHCTIPRDVRVTVQDATLTLSGRVDWPYQRRTAERAVRDIRGVRDLVNAMTVAPRAAVRDLEHRITRTLHHNADVDANRINVKVMRDCATLTGTVGSWLQREAAARAVADAPGIARVENLLTVQSPPEPVDELC
jgi:osmotically-inducible protein OsmY